MSNKRTTPGRAIHKRYMDESEIIKSYMFRQMIAIISLIAVTLAVIAIFWQVFDPQKKYDSVKTRFFAELDTQTKRGFIGTLEDVEMVRLGVSKEGRNEKLMSADLEGLLSEYLVTAGSGSNSDDTTQAAKAEIIKSIISVLRTEKPFSVLPEEDQITAIELKKSIESEDKQSSLSRLEVLSKSLGKSISTLGARADSGYRWGIIGVIVACAGLAWG